MADHFFLSFTAFNISKVIQSLTHGYIVALPELFRIKKRGLVMENSMEKRDVQRIQLEVPIQVGESSGLTRNISGNGIYFVTKEAFAPDQNIHFSLELDYVVPGKLLQLDCHGQIVRIESLGEEYGVAAKIDRYCCLQ